MFYSPVFGTINSTGQFTIPGGSHSFYINIQSGTAFVNGVQYWSPQAFQGGGLDSKMIITFGSGINFGTTGVGNRINYWYL